MGFYVGCAFAALVVYAIYQMARIVPQRTSFIIERLGRYSKTLEAGFHLLVPFVDRVAYKHSLKEVAVDVPRQACVTRDNIQIVVDGVLYMQIVDPKLASYGIENLQYAAVNLAQTTLRSIIGKIDLDKTFEERDDINVKVVNALNEASGPWGVKVLRYEIADIQLPDSIRDALEKQMRAERERRAIVAESEGQRQAKINVSEGFKQEMINMSEAEKARQINVAEGKAAEIELLATATAMGIEKVAQAINSEGGQSAVNLRVAEQYVAQFGHLAKEGTTMIIPVDLANIGGSVAGIMKTMDVIGKACPKV
jgi:regulator of protease activity HflC (stomatin/prohibitin superfamily)